MKIPKSRPAILRARSTRDFGVDQLSLRSMIFKGRSRGEPGILGPYCQSPPDAVSDAVLPQARLRFSNAQIFVHVLKLHLWVFYPGWRST